MSALTSPSSISPADSAALAPRTDRLLITATFLALGLSTLMRIFVGADQPLWLDEVGTGAIISPTSLPTFLNRIYLDNTPPFYSCVLYFWKFVAGTSNIALRLPGVVFGILAPLVLLRGRVPGLGKEEQITWGVLLALWIPGLWDSQDARTYTLLLLISAAQTIAFARLMSAPGLRLASQWCGLSVLAILTHDHSLVLSGLQGLAYLCLHRRRAIDTWPAAILLLIPIAWVTIHLPHILKYLPADVAWYSLLHVTDLPNAVAYLFGDALLLLAIPLVVLGGWVVGRRAGRERSVWQGTSPLWITVGTSLGALLFILAVGFVRPTFTSRYLTPVVPGFMLGLSLLLKPAAQRSAIVRPAVILLFLIAAIGWARQEMVPGAWAKGETREIERILNFEIASDMLMEIRPDRLVFLWDHPAGRVMAPDLLAAMGGFFFHRRGMDLAVTPVVLERDENANPRLLRLASAPRSAILWIYDTAVQGTSATTHAPRLSELDPRWQCHNFGLGRFGVLACVRKEDA